MKRFQCDCGQQVFFDSLHCTRCGTTLGFDDLSLRLVTLRPRSDGGYVDDSGSAFRPCRNRNEFGICNWVVPIDSVETYCRSCRTSAVIPNLSDAGNLALWGRLEQAKRRLLYTLLSLGLPLDGIEGGPRMAFRFLQDQRANPLVEDEFVATGHHSGTITINVAEADDSTRHAMREAMQERYRTLLGHFRHESGHYYYYVATQDDLDGFRSLFGDERVDYQQAMRSYFERRPLAAEWSNEFISQYASAHPLEDWAESWAHYLHIVDTLETAAAWGLIDDEITPGVEGWLESWIDLAVTMNELNRSMGADDAYPFVLSSKILGKLEFIHRRVERMASETAASAGR